MNPNKMENLNTQEAVAEKPEVQAFEAPAPSNEVSQRLSEEAQKAEKLATETLEQIKKMNHTEIIPGKAEAPKTEAEKLIVEKIGYNTEEIARLKEEFSGLSSTEAYNKFQRLSLQAIEDFFVTSGKNLKPSEKGEAMRLMKTIDSQALAGADKNAAYAASKNISEKAILPFASLMKQCNTGADGSTIFGGVTSLLAKNGFDNRNALVRTFGSPNVGLENFQNTLAETVLTKKQAEDIKKMSKVADKGSFTIGGSKNDSGTVRSSGVDSALSSRAVDELLDKAA